MHSEKSLITTERYKITFNVVAGAEDGNVNLGFEKLARIINMHVASGNSVENIELEMAVSGTKSVEFF